MNLKEFLTNKEKGTVVALCIKLQDSEFDSNPSLAKSRTIQQVADKARVSKKRIKIDTHRESGYVYVKAWVAIKEGVK